MHRIQNRKRIPFQRPGLHAWGHVFVCDPRLRVVCTPPDAPNARLAPPSCGNWACYPLPVGPPAEWQNERVLGHQLHRWGPSPWVGGARNRRYAHSVHRALPVWEGGRGWGLVADRCLVGLGFRKAVVSVALKAGLGICKVISSLPLSSPQLRLALLSPYLQLTCTH